MVLKKVKKNKTIQVLILCKIINIFPPFLLFLMYKALNNDPIIFIKIILKYVYARHTYFPSNT